MPVIERLHLLGQIGHAITLVVELVADVLRHVRPRAPFEIHSVRRARSTMEIARQPSARNRSTSASTNSGSVKVDRSLSEYMNMKFGLMATRSASSDTFSSR